MNPLLPEPDDIPSVGCPGDPRQIRFYGCVKCQRYHVEGTLPFREHLYFQDKHGIQSMGREEYFRLVAGGN
jgi:hypothetical protein